MNLNTPTHIGIDVSKARLDVHIPGHPHLQVANSTGGLEELFAALSGVESPHLVCESTAGYQKLLASTCLLRGVPVSVVQPARARHFALAAGILASLPRPTASMPNSCRHTEPPTSPRSWWLLSPRRSPCVRCLKPAGCWSNSSPTPTTVSNSPRASCATRC